MMKPTLLIVLGIFCTLLSFNSFSQTSCQGIVFNSPGEPSNCTYKYTNSGWIDANGNSISKPGRINAGETVCFYADNSDAKFNSVKGTLYIAENVTYSGDPGSVSSTGTVIVAGTSTMRFPSYNGAKIYIEPTGVYNETLNYSPSGSTTMYNAGHVNVPQNLNIGGSAVVYNFQDAVFSVKSTSYSKISNTFLNCGLLEFPNGYLDTTGSTNLQNHCSTHIAKDFNTNSTFYNYGLIIAEGTWTTSGADLYNEGTLMFDYLNLSNNHIIGNEINSTLIINGHSQLNSGASITGHMYYDVDDGGGIDSVCGSCGGDVEILFDMDIPTVIEDIKANCGEVVKPKAPLSKATLDFDGVDDYLSTPAFINGLSNITLMAWVKSDNGNTSTMTIAGEDASARLYLTGGKNPRFSINTLTGAKTVSAPAINQNEWHHITGTYSSSSKDIKLYVDGELAGSSIDLLSGTIRNSANSNGNFEIGRRSSNVTNKEYFKGDIDEVRVFNKELTADQIQRVVYQEIVNNSSYIRGSVIEKDIIDITSQNKLAWSSLLAYYPMTDIISYKRTTDYSDNGRFTRLNNITTIQEQTAPMPYETSRNGNWSSQNTWLHGNVWDIENTSTNKDWSIVRINHNVNTTSSHTNLGLFVANNTTLTVENDNKIENTWYLDLSGTIDLKDDSQLVQGLYSDLVTSINGSIKRRQQGTSDYYYYNYWSSPVGENAFTSFIDNNTSSNNPNNTYFQLGMLKDQNGKNMGFTAERDALNKISTRWSYKFQNGVTYYDWISLNNASDIEPGVGYIHKGTGINAATQEYIFEGKPNNGTIKLNVSDFGGVGSISGLSRTNYLLGNPYASALDLQQFINDNAGIISGTIQLWQQWDGTTHNLSQYEGGYATVNKLGSVRAYQFQGLDGALTSLQNGTKTPTRYLPVSQGFVVEIVSNGTIEFNNGQRVFVKEADANNSYGQGSVFFRTRDTNREMGSTDDGVFSKIRLEFNNVDGPIANRELLLGFSDLTSDAYDYGYDAINGDTHEDDLNLIWEEDNMLMQAYSSITPDMSVPLSFSASGNFSYTIKASELEDIDSDYDVFLKDGLTGEFFDLRTNKAYTFTSEAGTFKDRFTIVFQSAQTLGTEEELVEVDGEKIFYSHSDKKLFVKGLNSDVKQLTVINLLGQTVKLLPDISAQNLNQGLTFTNLSTGAYIVSIKTYDNHSYDKKIIIN